MPKWVFVKFQNKDGSDVSWQFKGTPGPGLYPIVAVQRNLYVDRNRLRPVLRTRRQQLPFGPAFAMTAHASQGQTFTGRVIVDLRLGGSS